MLCSESCKPGRMPASGDLSACCRTSKTILPRASSQFLSAPGWQLFAMADHRDRHNPKASAEASNHYGKAFSLTSVASGRLPKFLFK